MKQLVYKLFSYRTTKERYFIMIIDKRKLDIAMGTSCYTFSELAIKSGVSRISINKLLTGKTTARPATIGKIAKALNVDVANIIKSEDEADGKDN